MQGDLQTRVIRGGAEVEAALSVSSAARQLIVISPNVWIGIEGDVDRVETLRSILEETAVSRDVVLRHVEIHSTFHYSDVSEAVPRRLQPPDVPQWVAFEPDPSITIESEVELWRAVADACTEDDFRVGVPTAEFGPGDSSVEAFRHDFGRWLDEVLRSASGSIALLAQKAEDLQRAIDQLLEQNEELERLAGMLRLEVGELEAELQRLQSLVGSLRARLRAKPLKWVANLVVYCVTTVVAVGAQSAPTIEIPDELTATTALVQTCDDIIRTEFGLDPPDDASSN